MPPDPPKTVLLTGGNGLLGSNVLRLLADNPSFRVIAPVRNIHAPSIQPLAGKIHFLPHDLGNSAQTATLVHKTRPDILVHCAASGLRQTHGSWHDAAHFNSTCTKALLEPNLHPPQPSHFIYISTGLVYRPQDRPLSEDDPLGTDHPYGAIKADTELLVQQASVDHHRRVTILRPFAFTGEFDDAPRLFPLILQAALRGKRQGLTAGTQIRDFCSVNDIARAVTLVMQRRQTTLLETFNLGSGQSRPLRELIETVCDELHLNPPLAFGERDTPPFEPRHSVANITRAQTQLGWQPRTGLAFAVWQLARQLAGPLNLKQPERHFGLAS